MKYFIHDPEDQTFFYKTEKDWEDAMMGFDFLGKYCDDGWSEEVENVIAGLIPIGIERSVDDEIDEYDFYYGWATHIATRSNERQRPDDVDEDGYSLSTGDWWSEDWDFICSYVFGKIK